MKLFIYDTKHEQVYSQSLPLPNITDKEVELLEKVFSFLEERGIFDRYSTGVLAENYRYIINEDREFEVEWIGQR